MLKKLSLGAATLFAVMSLVGCGWSETTTWQVGHDGHSSFGSDASSGSSDSGAGTTTNIACTGVGQCNDENPSTSDTCNLITGRCEYNTQAFGNFSNTLPTSCGQWGAWIFVPYAAQWRIGFDLTGHHPTEIDIYLSTSQWVGLSLTRSMWGWLAPWGTMLPAGVLGADHCGKQFAPKVTYSGRIGVVSHDQK